MVSKWYEYKDKAINLRRKGKSISYVELKLSIPRSTLSGWFKTIKLSDAQKQKLKNNSNLALINSRKKAILWHHSQKNKRIQEANIQADTVLNRINTNNKDILELTLAFLYLGEGAKNKTTSLGNSNPQILKFFISAINSIYKDARLGKCKLHLRSDQDEIKEIKYWSKELDINKEKFGFIKDKRIVKSKTYPNYHGVCVIRFGNIAIQRRLLFLSQKYCNIIASMDD